MKKFINKVIISAILWASFLATGNLQAATVTWGPATNVVNDSDISTKGVLRYAEHWAGTEVTVNGVTFKVMKGGGQTKTVSWEQGALSPEYFDILRGVCFGAGPGTTVSLNSLEPGHNYQVQIWAVDKRYATSQYQNISGGPSLSIGTGQYAIGTFTADAATQVITMGADSAGILSAIQVRDVTPGLDGKMPPVSGKTVTTKLSRGSHQFTPDFKLKPDDFTVLMGVDAELSDGLARAIRSAHGKFEVKGWTRADQSATWKITAAEAAPHEVFVLVNRANSQQPLTFKVNVAGQSLSGTLPAKSDGWQRVKLDGLLNIPAGESTVSLNIAAADGKADFKAEFHAVELIRPAVHAELTKRALAMRADPTWFQNARYGMMVTWSSQSMPLKGEQKPYAQAVADFDVEAFADAMKSTGAGFVVFGTSHAMQYFPAPLKSLDAILPGRTAQRDLPADLAAALAKRGMKLFLYFHLGAQNDPDWLKASGFWETDTTKFFNNWKSIISEAGERYGDKLAGWWFDDGTTNYYYRSAPWESLAKAAKAGNPQRMIGYNPWKMNNATQFHDYCTGEGSTDPRGMGALLTPESKGRYPSGTHAGLQASACVIADSTWVHTSRNTPPSGPRWNADQLTGLIKGFIAYKNVPIFNLEITQDGQLSAESIAVFKQAAAGLK